MKTAERTAMMRLALAALDREHPNVDLALGLLRDLAGEEPVEIVASPITTDACSIGEAARKLGYSAKTIRTMIARGDLPAIGTGRATRVIIGEAINALRRSNSSKDVRGVEPADPIEALGASWGAGRTGGLQ